MIATVRVCDATRSLVILTSATSCEQTLHTRICLQPRCCELGLSMASRQSSCTQPRSTSLEEQVLITPDSFLPIYDRPYQPPFSLSKLIKMSILNSPSNRLKLNQIYKWISETYPFYKSSDATWQNSIRSTLSVSKIFAREGRSEGDRGLGGYWTIQEDARSRTRKSRARRKSPCSLSSPSLEPTAPELNPPLAIRADVPSDTIWTPPESLAREGVDDGLAYPSNLMSSPLRPQLAEINRYFPTTKGISPSDIPRASLSCSSPRYFDTRNHWPQQPLRTEPHGAKKVRFSLLSCTSRPNIKRGRAEVEIARLRRESKTRALLSLP